MPAGYDLAGTLGILPRGRQDPTCRIGSGGVWLAFATPAGPVTLHLAARADAAATAVTAGCWGPGVEAALAGLPALLGAGDDWSGFDDPDFQATLPRLVTEPRRRHRGLRLPSTGRVFDALVPAVLEQRVTTIEARHSWRYLVARHGSPAPGPAPAGLMLAPSPAQWRRIPSWEWHRAGVDPKRSATILRACAVAAGLDRLAALPPGPDLAAKLCSVPGIGPWTAAEIAQRTHGDPDSVSVGDFHLAAFVGYALTGRRTDDAGMLRLLQPWRGHRQRVVRMLGLSGVRKPAFGPRLSPQDHRFH
ncbi:3-methyladenine DNA glycosylase [Arthrobacter sp. E918]|uniref:3-methyladenine DNA glycosylase n=2 Tax=Arthrobacter mobilis TaxID=2724944 RepID=A0A7X6HBJ1_9MICC|nr:3-methyladenine DNA glycosylase [Arthrobacter mobilis]NKX53505.1 3-methyladenine DNA glycosylase [Arthrobacter mobilis]